MTSLPFCRELQLAVVALFAGALFGACTTDTSDPISPMCTVNCGAGDAGVQLPPIGDSGQSIATDSGTHLGDASSSVGAGALPCTVQTIIKDKCQLCHADPPAFGAPMALVNDGHFQATGKTDMSKKVYQLVKTRVNTTTTTLHMPPSTSPQLSATELTTLNAWLDQNAPASSGSCVPTPTDMVPVSDGGVSTGDPTADKTGLDCYKFLAHAQGDKTKPYPVGVATDQYLAFGFSAPWTGTVYAEVISPVIGNPMAIHHWLLYEEGNTDGDISATIGAHPGGKLLAGWAPGGQSYNFRKFGDIGYELTSPTYTLEIHYNSSNAANTDASGVEVCVQKTKPQNVAGMTWLGTDNFGTAATTWTGTCTPASSTPIHILFVTPHEHQAGRHLTSIIKGPSGMRTLLDQPFDFNYQVTYEKTETLMPGESITTTCTYSTPKSFGQATTAEMCYLFTYAYPKGALADNGIQGLLTHGEGTCLGQ